MPASSYQPVPASDSDLEENNNNTSSNNNNNNRSNNNRSKTIRVYNNSNFSEKKPKDHDSSDDITAAAVNPASFRSSASRRRPFVLAAALLLVFVTLSCLTKHDGPEDEDDSHSSNLKFHSGQSFFPPRLNDNNPLFSGPGKDVPSSEDTLDKLINDISSSSTTDGASDKISLAMDSASLGFDAWTAEGTEVPSKPPTIYDEDKDAFVPIKVFGDKKPGDNMLIRPIPARKPNTHQCTGPAYYKWEGPEKITVDVNEFNRFYLLVKSAFVTAEINYKEADENEVAENNLIVIRPDIRFVDPEFNKIIEVTEKKDDVKKGFVLRVSTPSWDKTGLGRSKCIFAKIDVTLPKGRHSLPLLGSGAITGKVDFANLPKNVEIGTLVGWAGAGPVHVKSAPSVREATLAVSNGAIYAHKLTVAESLRSKIVNGPQELSVVPSSENFALKVSSVNGGITALVDKAFTGSFHLATVNGRTSAEGEDIEFRHKTDRFTDGTVGQGNMEADLKTVNGFVNLAIKKV